MHLTENDANSHRLIYYAGTKGTAQQDALVEELFLNYFSEEKYIGDPSILVAAAEKVCMRFGGGCAMWRGGGGCAMWRRRQIAAPQSRKVALEGGAVGKEEPWGRRSRGEGGAAACEGPCAQDERPAPDLAPGNDKVLIRAGGTCRPDSTRARCKRSSPTLPCSGRRLKTRRRASGAACGELDPSPVKRWLGKSKGRERGKRWLELVREASCDGLVVLAMLAGACPSSSSTAKRRCPARSRPKPSKKSLARCSRPN